MKVDKSFAGTTAMYKFPTWGDETGILNPMPTATTPQRPSANTYQNPYSTALTANPYHPYANMTGPNPRMTVPNRPVQQARPTYAGPATPPTAFNRNLPLHLKRLGWRMGLNGELIPPGATAPNPVVADAGGGYTNPYNF